MKQYKYLLFDLDDTLIDNLENVKHAFKKMLEYMGEEYSEEKMIHWFNVDRDFWYERRCGGIVVPDEYMFPQELMIKWVRAQRYIIYFDHKISLEKAFEINEVYLRGLHEVVIPIEGAYETLEYLSGKYDIVIATNGPASPAISKMEKIDCLKFVKEVLAAETLGYNKPAKGFFDNLQKRLGLYNFGECLFIGNSLNSDVEGAMGVEMDSCWFDRDEEELTDEHKPTYIIKKLIELKNLL